MDSDLDAYNIPLPVDSDEESFDDNISPHDLEVSESSLSSQIYEKISFQEHTDKSSTSEASYQRSWNEETVPLMVDSLESIDSQVYMDEYCDLSQLGQQRSIDDYLNFPLLTHSSSLSIGSLIVPHEKAVLIPQQRFKFASESDSCSSLNPLLPLSPAISSDMDEMFQDFVDSMTIKLRNEEEFLRKEKVQLLESYNSLKERSLPFLTPPRPLKAETINSAVKSKSLALRDSPNSNKILATRFMKTDSVANTLPRPLKAETVNIAAKFKSLVLWDSPNSNKLVATRLMKTEALAKTPPRPLKAETISKGATSKLSFLRDSPVWKQLPLTPSMKTEADVKTPKSVPFIRYTKDYLLSLRNHPHSNRAPDVTYPEVYRMIKNNIAELTPKKASKPTTMNLLSRQFNMIHSVLLKTSNYKRFSSFDLTIEHSLTYKEKWPWTPNCSKPIPYCRTCHWGFETYTLLIDHMEKKHGEKFKIPTKLETYSRHFDILYLDDVPELSQDAEVHIVIKNRLTQVLNIRSIHVIHENMYKRVDITHKARVFKFGSYERLAISHKYLSGNIKMLPIVVIFFKDDIDYVEIHCINVWKNQSYNSS